LFFSSHWGTQIHFTLWQCRLPQTLFNVPLCNCKQPWVVPCPIIISWLLI
jgi:hypothetical protein